MFNIFKKKPQPAPAVFADLNDDARVVAIQSIRTMISELEIRIERANKDSRDNFASAATFDDHAAKSRAEGSRYREEAYRLNQQRNSLLTSIGELK